MSLLQNFAARFWVLLLSGFIAVLWLFKPLLCRFSPVWLSLIFWSRLWRLWRGARSALGGGADCFVRLSFCRRRDCPADLAFVEQSDSALC